MENLKEIPKEIKETYPECRWVEIKNSEEDIFFPRIFLDDLGEKINNRFVCVGISTENNFLSGREFSCCMWKFMREISQEPKKIPYTIETFPKNALWAKTKDKQNLICSRSNNKISFCDKEWKFDDKFLIENYEIGCQIVKDGKIETVWLPFYQIKK